MSALGRCWSVCAWDRVPFTPFARQEVIRTEGRTEAIVDEGIAVVSYALDDVGASLCTVLTLRTPRWVSTSFSKRTLFSAFRAAAEAAL